MGVTLEERRLAERSCEVMSNMINMMIVLARDGGYTAEALNDGMRDKLLTQAFSLMDHEPFTDRAHLSSVHCSSTAAIGAAMSARINGAIDAGQAITDYGAVAMENMAANLFMAKACLVEAKEELEQWRAHALVVEVQLTQANEREHAKNAKIAELEARLRVYEAR